MFERKKKITHPDQIESHLVDAMYAPGVLVVESAEGQPVSYFGRHEEYRTTRGLYSPEKPNLYAPKDSIVRVAIAHETDVARVLIDRDRELDEADEQYFDASDPRLGCLYFGIAGLYRSIKGAKEGTSALKARWQYATDLAAQERLQATIAHATLQAETMITRLGEK